MAVLSGCASGTADEKKAAEVKSEVLPQKQQDPAPEEEIPSEVRLIEPGTATVLKVFKPEDLGYGTDNEAYKATVQQWAKELARGSGNADGYDRRMKADKLDAGGQITKGQNRIILDEEGLLQSVLAISEKGGDVELPVTETASGYTPDEAARLHEVVVASYSTRFNSGDTGRSKNIELSAAALNNVIIGRGDIVSFNDTVGPREEGLGYQPAPEALNGELVMGIGGGVCQTSSTLFNAVDQISFEYVERHHHSVNVGYVPKGRDATVSYGGLDFRFQNMTGIPLLLKTKTANGTLTVEVRTSRAYAGMMQ